MVITVIVLSIIIVIGVVGLFLEARKSYKSTEILIVDRSLSRLPDSSSYELWRAAAAQSQTASDKRRGRE